MCTYISIDIYKINAYIFSIVRLELKLKQVESELVKAKELIVTTTNNNNKNESTIKRLKKQLYMITWVNNYITFFVNDLNCLC